MVFFTSLLIVIIFYYLQTEGLIFVTIIAVIGELINIFLTQTAAKASEKKTAIKFSKVVQGYKSKIESQKKTITELEKIQAASVSKLINAREKIKGYEKKLGIVSKESEGGIEISSSAKPKKPKAPKDQEVDHIDPKTFDDLPAGSNRKKLPF